MEIRILDEKFQLLSIIDDFQSLIWHRKYYEAGNFELILGEKYIHLAGWTASYILIKGFTEIGMIEDTGWEQASNTVSLKGRFLEALLDNFIIQADRNYTGTPESINRTLVQTFYYGQPPITTAALSGIGTSVSMQAGGVSLYEKCYELAKSQEQSVQLTYDLLGGNAVFHTWEGLDRTNRQNTNSLAIFSDDFENIVSANFVSSRKDYKNIAYVAGGGEGSSRIIEKVDRRAGGEQPRELWIDASDLSQEDISAAEYRKQLIQRGIEQLAEYKTIQDMSASVNPNANLQYKVDYDLGDKCSVTCNPLRLYMDDRITEIVETYENNAQTLDIVFGESEKTIMQVIKREVR